jgi:two-component system, sensor histidine kinase and response regulator
MYRRWCMDVVMPQMNGFEVVERIREIPELSPSTILMLTSLGQRGDAKRCRELGVSAYLVKPIRQTELYEAIVRTLGAGLQKDAEALITRHTLRESGRQKPGLRVLLAEDNVINQRVVLRLLEKRGHEVVIATNGRQVLEALEKDGYDLVLMDVQMPEMDGLQATTAIRGKEQITRRHQLIVALTAHAMKGDSDRCMAAGMDFYLSKPIRPEDLDEVLRTLANRRAKPQEPIPWNWSTKENEGRTCFCSPRNSDPLIAGPCSTVAPSHARCGRFFSFYAVPFLAAAVS